MIPRPRFTRGPGGLILFGLLMALCAISGPASAQIQDNGFILIVSSKKVVTKDTLNLLEEKPLLRPNVAQNYFIHIQNPKKKAADLKVEIQAGGKAIDGGVWNGKITANDSFITVPL